MSQEPNKPENIKAAFAPLAAFFKRISQSLRESPFTKELQQDSQRLKKEIRTTPGKASIIAKTLNNTLIKAFPLLVSLIINLNNETDSRVSQLYTALFGISIIPLFCLECIASHFALQQKQAPIKLTHQSFWLNNVFILIYLICAAVLNPMPSSQNNLFIVVKLIAPLLVILSYFLSDQLLVTDLKIKDQVLFQMLKEKHWRWRSYFLVLLVLIILVFVFQLYRSLLFNLLLYLLAFILLHFFFLKYLRI